MRTVLVAIAMVAITDVALQLDNALAVSAVASTLAGRERALVLVGGLLLSAICLFGFTLLGASLIQRAAWLKPIAGVVLVVIGVKLALDFFGPHLSA
jgi:predicted tellurium resistance membrane protein TerC